MKCELNWNINEINEFINEIKKYIICNKHNSLIFILITKCIKNNNNNIKYIYDSFGKKINLNNIFNLFSQ